MALGDRRLAWCSPYKGFHIVVEEIKPCALGRFCAEAFRERPGVTAVAAMKSLLCPDFIYYIW